MLTLETIPTLADFRQAVDFNKHDNVPDDWTLYLTDIKTSTKAIEQGRYKDVNVIAASCIMAVLNAVGRAPIPYVFGGDGVTLVVPPNFKDATLNALLATQRISETRFGLELRVGRVSVGDLRARGGELRVAKMELSPGFFQSVLSGSGMGLLESWLKDPSPNNPYLIHADETATGDFTGLECRWEPIKSERGEMVSVVAVASGASETARSTYMKLMKEVDRMKKTISLSGLKLSSSFQGYSAESKFRSKTSRFFYQTKAFLLTRLFSFLWNTILRKDGNAYKKALADRTDYLKFDGGLKFILDLTASESSRLEAFLENEYQLGRLVYGIHRSPSALLTCLVFDRSDSGHVHFLDGSNGGYTQAAAQMKTRLHKEKSSRAAS